MNSISDIIDPKGKYKMYKTLYFYSKDRVFPFHFRFQGSYRDLKDLNQTILLCINNGISYRILDRRLPCKGDAAQVTNHVMS